jgi:hypothetical protein
VPLCARIFWPSFSGCPAERRSVFRLGVREPQARLVSVCEFNSGQLQHLPQHLYRPIFQFVTSLKSRNSIR